MFIKTTIALALVLATASGALAATKKHSTNGGFEAYGAMGTDPDSRIRGDLLRSSVSE
jgi:hypothetical protein